MVIALAVAGCKPAPTVATHPVSGRITIHQKPLAGAAVTFANNDRDSYSASATTDEDGRFKLATYVSAREVYAGAVPGEYTVLITKAPPGEAAPDDMAKMEHATQKERDAFMINRMQRFMESERTGDKPKSEVPEKYGSADSSPLKATIVIGQNEPFERDLTE